MSTEIAANNVGSAMVVPAHLASAFGESEFNSKDVSSVPHLSIKGKLWKVVIDGVEKVMMIKDEDGEETPRPTVKVLILNQVEQRSRTFFRGSYTEGDKAQPDCWSTSGKAPDAQVETPQATRCDACPQSIRGSKINDNGDSTTACSMSRRIAVVPSSKPDFKALLLKLPVTSLWEKEGSEEPQGWYAYEAYLKNLKVNGVAHPGMVETIMKFDSKNVSYPKVLFRQNGFIDEAKATITAPRGTSEEVLEVLGIGEGSDAPNTNALTTPSADVDSVEDTDSDEANEAEAQAVKAAEESLAKKEAKEAKAAKAKAARELKAEKAKAEKEAKAQAEAATEVTTVEGSESIEDVLDDWD